MTESPCDCDDGVLPLNKDVKETTKYISLAMKEAAILLCASVADRHLEDLVTSADRVFCFNEGPRAEPRINAKTNPKSQTTLEAFS